MALVRGLLSHAEMVRRGRAALTVEEIGEVRAGLAELDRSLAEEVRSREE